MAERCPHLGLEAGAEPGASPGKLQERAPWQRPAFRRPELAPISAAKRRRRHRRLSAVELTILALSAAIGLAVLFVGYALVFRLQAGPGMEAPPPVARQVERVAAEGLPTLLPTFTPTPTAAPVVVTLEPPTPPAQPTLPAPTAVVRIPASSPPTRLVIPRLGLDIPILPVGVKTVGEGARSRVVWADVPNAGGFHTMSAYPGNPGNTVINGHRDIQGAVFRHLDRMEPGDPLTLYVGDVAYDYVVAETLVVPERFASAEQRAENLRLIGTWPEERLTLITCTPVGLATHRLLVIARPPQPAPPDMPEAGSNEAP